MNDFTKEELTQIRSFIVNNTIDSYDDLRFSVILHKLQTMIDNYCKNDSIGQSDLPTAGTDE